MVMVMVLLMAMLVITTMIMGIVISMTEVGNRNGNIIKYLFGVHVFYLVFGRAFCPICGMHLDFVT